jgi:hypothetical protein
MTVADPGAVADSVVVADSFVVADSEAAADPVVTADPEAGASSLTWRTLPSPDAVAARRHTPLEPGVQDFWVMA